MIPVSVAAKAMIAIIPSRSEVAWQLNVMSFQILCWSFACCADALPADKPETKARVNIAVMKRFMGFLSEAEEVDVLRNEPAYRIDVSPQFENNYRIRCFALKQHGACKMAQQNAAWKLL